MCIQMSYVEMSSCQCRKECCSTKMVLKAILFAPTYENALYVRKMKIIPRKILFILNQMTNILCKFILYVRKIFKIDLFLKNYPNFKSQYLKN